MRTNLFGGAVLGLLVLASSSFAGWDATDKALGHEGNKLSGSNRNYYAQQTYRAQPTYRAAPVMTTQAAPVVVAAPVAVPQVAATNSNTERRSFSVEPGPAPVVSNNAVQMNNNVQNNAVYSAPRSYNYGTRAQHQPNWTQADTKIRGREGN